MTPGRAIAAVLRAVLPYGLVPYWATVGAGENVKPGAALHMTRIRFRLDNDRPLVTGDSPRILGRRSAGETERWRDA